MRRLILGASLAVLAVGCGSLGTIPIEKFPPIVIGTIPPATTMPPETPAPAPELATLAVVVRDAWTGEPIPGAAVMFVGFHRDALRTNADGYASDVAPRRAWRVKVWADEYETLELEVSTEAGNWQATARLKSTRPPAPAPPIAPAPTPAPIAPAPPASPACVALACVLEAARLYPRLLELNTFDSTTEFTQRALELLGPEWGHVGKTAGEGQGVPRGFTPRTVSGFVITGVSYDAIKHRTTGQVIDLLGNATANEPCDPRELPAGVECWKHGPASPHWEIVPPQYWRPNNPFVPAVPVR